MVLGALVGGGKGAETEWASCASPRGLWKNSGLHARSVRTWKFGALFRRGLVPDCYLYSVWVLPVGARKFGFSGRWLHGILLGETVHMKVNSSVRNFWFDSGYMLCVSTPCFWTNCTQFSR